MTEDYTRSRTLRTFEFRGEEFRIVKRRVNGKPWRGYLMLLHDNVPMITSYRDGDVADAETFWLEALKRVFKTKTALVEEIAAQKKRMEDKS